MSDEPVPVLGSRAWFPDLQPRVYLNHAGISPPGEPLRRAVNARLAAYAREGAGAFEAAMGEREAVKAGLARLLGCLPDDLALTGSTTRGLIDLSSALSFRPDERILCFEKEFPANVTPWIQAAKATGARVELLPQEGISDEALLDGIYSALTDGGVRLIAVSAVQFSTGRVMPLAEICELAHQFGAEVCVDAIQAVGVLPLDLGTLPVDYLAGGTHKWLMGVEGLGYVFARPEKAQRLMPRTAGWMSHEDAFDFLQQGAGFLRYDRPIRPRIDFLEGHSLNALGCAALSASLAALEKLGVEAIYAHVSAYLDALEAGLLDRGFRSLRAGRSGILSVLPPEGDDPLRWAEALGRRGIALSVPDGKIRLSPHWPNALDEVPQVLEAVDAARAEVH